jgi:iron complex outermembrane receptor protein
MRLPVLFFLLGSVAGARGQDAVITGTITDAKSGERLIGVNVTWAPGRGVASDVNGAYRLSLPSGAPRITFSYVGYETFEKDVLLDPGSELVLDAQLVGASAQLETVVVSAGKFEQRVGEVSQSLSVLRPELLRNKNVTTMPEALDQVPGVVVIDEDPQIRACSGFSYGAGSRVMLLVDDLPILSGDIGRAQWGFLPIENLEQVEVIKGASSVLYGSAALTGVINVRTAYPRADPSTRVNVFGGVYDTPGHEPAKWWDQNPPLFTGANFFHAQQFGQLDLVLGGNAFADAGHVGPEPLPADSLAGSDPLHIGPGGYENRIRANAGVRWRNRKMRMNYGVNVNAMKSRSTSVFIWDDTDRGLYRPEPNTVTRTLGAQMYVDPYFNYYSAQGTRHSLRTRYYRQQFDNDNDQANGSYFIFGEYQVQQRANLFGESTVTAGLVGQRTLSQAELYSGNEEGDDENTAANAGAYLQIDKKLWERLTLSAGVRYEQFTVNEDQQSEPVFRAGATCRVMKATYVRASYGQGFRFPTIGERFITTSVGDLNIFPNPALRPEKSWGAEAGVKQGFVLGKFSGYLDAVAFQQEFEDYIEFTFGQWGDPLDIENLLGLGFMSVNTGGARVTGIEMEITAQGMVGAVELALLAGYTHTLPISTTPQYEYAVPTYSNSLWPASTFENTSYDATDNILKFRVQDMFRTDVQASYQRLHVGGSIRYNSHVRNIDQAFVEFDDNGRLPTGVHGWMETHTTGDWIVDARIGLALSEQARVSFIANNLTNEVYAIRPLSIEAPRSMQIQLSWSM